MAMDMEERALLFQKEYVPISREEGVPYIKLIDLSQQIEVHSIRGYLPSKIVCLLMNVNVLQ
jgi:hypothetical protein